MLATSIMSPQRDVGLSVYHEALEHRHLFIRRSCPNDVRLTLEQAIPGGMILEDYSLMREVIGAIRKGLPEADQLQPGAVFQHVLGALHDCPKSQLIGALTTAEHSA
jgi:hypothetical protein